MPDTGAYLREIPDDVSPALAGAVWRRGKLGEKEVIATLVDLTARGVLSVRTGERHVTTITGPLAEQTTEFVLDTTRWDELDPLDQELCCLLFTTLAHSAVLGLLDLRTIIRTRPRSYGRGIHHWKAHVVAEAVRRGLLARNERSLTDGGARLAEDLGRLKGYIEHFGALDDDPLAATALWGRYLAFAALFGLAETALAELELDGGGVLADTALALRGLAG